MKKELEIINRTEILGRELKVYGDTDNPLFLAKDIAEWIEHSDVSMMVKNLEVGEEKLIQTMLVSGQNREVTLLTENGVYEVLMTSRKPIAKDFRKGFKEFLKAWRKNEVKVVDSRATNLTPYKNGGSHWLPSEDIELERMELRGVPRREMSEYFGRSLKAVSNRIDLLMPSSRNTLTKNTNLKKYLSNEETCTFEDVVIFMFKKLEFKPVEISEKLNVSKKEISNILIEANFVNGLSSELEFLADQLKKLGNSNETISKVLKVDVETLNMFL